MNQSVKNNVQRYILLLIAVVVFGCGGNDVFAQTSQSSLYVPLIGISSVPDPLALPGGAGDVAYHYAVKNFLSEYPLTDIHVTDDTCDPITFVEGDDNNDGRLDHSETWRYACTTQLSVTTQSVATVIGTANDLLAVHKAYTTVVVDSDDPAPLVNIINVTKVAYPLTLPIGGGDITFTYRVNNPGIVPLSDVGVTDDKCSAMSRKLGDTNGNNLLDITEVWVYTCTTHLNQTTTNTVSVTASANGLKAVGYATITVTVATPIGVSSSIDAPDTGGGFNIKMTIWGILLGILAILFVLFAVTRRSKVPEAHHISNPQNRGRKHLGIKTLSQVIVLALFSAVVAGTGYYFLLLFTPNQNNVSNNLALNIVDEGFGWKYPVVKFPTTGPGELAYSDIRDPGGIPEGLPVRLQIPSIGVDSAIEDALITPEGRMDVPAGSRNVAWFALGPHPGREGSAVIGGHFGIRDGVPFVFYDLDKLTVGDKIYVVDDKGKTLAFIVRSIGLFERDADATTVFTSDDGLAHLNLVTCEGIWNRVNDTYPQRRVVFTDAIPAEGAVTEAITTFSRSLDIGDSGADVKALQAVLERKGLLVMPPEVERGFFGTLTRTAVAAYQTSVGLTPVGVFGSLTRDRLTAELAVRTPSPIGAFAPQLPQAALTPAIPSPRPLFVRTVQVLFATPIDVLVTFLLLFSLVFITLKLIKP